MTQPDRKGEVLNALQARGSATAKQIAADLGIKSQYASRHLGILFDRSQVGREMVDFMTREFVYRFKPQTDDAPPLAPHWQPERRIAERQLQALAREADRLTELENAR